MRSKTSLRFALDATQSCIGDPRASGEASEVGKRVLRVLDRKPLQLAITCRVTKKWL